MKVCVLSRKRQTGPVSEKVIKRERCSGSFAVQRSVQFYRGGVRIVAESSGHLFAAGARFKWEGDVEGGKKKKKRRRKKR